ncbi:hypothetical protein [Chryseobacterium joostei]|uniref:hypothetical protein n=1 Tax=Chryseobacterium joostei TaxID=112234 RepID=UPI003D1521B3
MEREIRKLPVISLVEGADFHVDALNQQLIDTTDHNNIIDVRRMHHREDGLECIYDTAARNLYSGRLDSAMVNQNRYLKIHLHRLEIYDREGAKILWEYEGEPFMKSKMIEVEIEGIKFLYDQDYRLFREKDNPYNVLNRPNMWFNRDGEYGCYFDRKMGCASMYHEVLKFQREGTFPPHIAFLKMPEIIDKVHKALNTAYYRMKVTRTKSRRIR